MDEKVSERYEEYKTFFPYYVEMGYADKERLSYLVCRAKGENRSLRKFADDIGVNVSTISRISNKRIARHVDSEVIAKIAAGAEAKNGILFNEMMMANGMKNIVFEKRHFSSVRQEQKTVEKRLIKYLQEARDERRKTEIQQTHSPNSYKDINISDQTWKAIANSLTEADIKYEIEFDDGKCHFWDYRVKSDVIDGDWVFEVRKCSNFSSINSAIRSIYKIMADHFRLDRDDYGKVSIVFDNSVAFKEAVYNFEQYAPPYEMSFILVTKFKIEQEFILKNPDGSSRHSIFNQ